jgi:Domain of unknown function (DUF1850)
VPATRSRRLLAAGATLTPLAAAGLVLAQDEAPAVVVHDESGEEVARAPLPAGNRFALTYRHSYYDAPAREAFRVERGGFRLRAVESPSAAVLDYYALKGPRTRSGRWLRIEPRPSRRFRELSLIATETGRRTLVVGERRVPLYGGRARHLTLSVDGGS